jgi:hypothetical protein
MPPTRKKAEWPVSRTTFRVSPAFVLAWLVADEARFFFAAYHRAAMRLTNRFSLVAGAFSSDPEVSRETGHALGVPPDRVYADYAEMVQLEAGRIR